MSILVAYATHSGATRTLADAIVAELGQLGIPGDAIDVRDDPDPSAHDAVIMGSAIRMDSVEKTFVTWAKKHEHLLGDRPVALFSCSGSAADPAKAGGQKGVEAFLSDAAFQPVAVRNFPGWLFLDRIPMHERVLMKAMRAPVGDFRDLDAVRAWVREIRPALDE